MLRSPKGWALHGSRSGQPRTTAEEFKSTANYGRITPFAFNHTWGDDMVADHLEPWEWGHHAFSASDDYIAGEFAQSGYGGVYQPIGDAQVRASAWSIKQDRGWWRSRGVIVPLRLRTHAELEHDGETVRTSGKTDPFPWADARADDLRRRLLARLAEMGER